MNSRPKTREHEKRRKNRHDCTNEKMLEIATPAPRKLDSDVGFGREKGVIYWDVASLQDLDHNLSGRK